MSYALLAFLDNPGMLLLLGIIAVLLFGERLPEVAQKFGKGIMELKKGVSGIQAEIKGAIDSSINSSTTNSSVSSYHESSYYSAPDTPEEATAPKFEPPPAKPAPPANSAQAAASAEYNS